MDLFVQMMKRYGSPITRELQRRHGIEGDAIVRAYRAALGVAVDQPTRAHRITGRAQLLECARGCRATKRITPDGISDYACGKWFATTEFEFSGFSGFADLLGEVERRPLWFLLRGRLIEGRHPGRVRRLLHPDQKTGDDPYFEPCPRHWCGLDFDSFDLPAGVDPVDIDAVAALAIERLPDSFRRASCWAQLTSGAGIKPGGRVRLFYVLDRPTSGADLKRWLGGVSGLDGSTLNEVTPNYVARPIFDGVADPVPVRSKLLAGEVDAVAVCIPPPPERRPRQAAGSAPVPSRAGGVHAKAYMAACKGGSARAEDFADGCLRRFALAPEGRRHTTCVSVSCCLLAMSKAGLLDPVRVAARIKGVAAGKDFDLSEVDAILDWAWRHVGPEGLPDVK